MSKVKLQVVEIGSADAYSDMNSVTDTGERRLLEGDVIQFDRMPNFETWDDINDTHPSKGYDWTPGMGTTGTNLRTGEHRRWIFHAVKFEKI
jgi:hypothetical protein